MIDNEIVTRINSALAEEFELEIEDIVPEARFKEELGLDSLDAVDMVIVLEQELNIKIKKDEAFKKIRSVEDLYNFILSKKTQA
ncbi:acyl carrier protein [Desulfovibrio gilichinskyi]|uniref:Acyl carrier protein n=1 Tax=Desulfovibrio gilichinskyi TaxID=1519643 RepID=A0A1X7DSR4_9BACT|nr:acyl carrier protein [Desulfovibrio gilichinskyi]SMF21080.1 acyl carrier protein [Desulfovibrio gilichinskyi]